MSGSPAKASSPTQVAFSPGDDYLAVGTNRRPSGAAAGSAHAGADRAEPSTCRAERQACHRPRLQRGRPVSGSGDPARPAADELRARCPIIRGGLGPEFAATGHPRSCARWPSVPRAWFSARTGARSTRPARSRRTTWRAAGSCGPPEFISWGVLDISPDGKLLASEVHDREQGASSKSGPIRLTDARTGETVGILRGHEDQPCDIRFSRDGRRLASVSWDGQLFRVGRVDRRAALHRGHLRDLLQRVLQPRRASGLHRWRRRELADLGPPRRPAVPAPDLRIARQAGHRRRPRVARRHADRLPLGRVRSASSTQPRDSTVDARVPGKFKAGPGRRGPGIPTDGTTRSLAGPTDHRAGRRDRGKDGTPSMVMGDASIYSMGYVDQGERLLVGDSAEPSLVPSMPTR